ncbi:MAG: hypothetical protein NT027_14035 [Proteobacteria bacterium]|nr:hypothetical protein [Pseudomonadota bacterium]
MPNRRKNFNELQGLINPLLPHASANACNGELEKNRFIMMAVGLHCQSTPATALK